MISGRETLAELNRTLDVVRREYTQVDQGMRSSAEVLTKNQLEQTQLLRELAALRSEQLAEGEILERLDAADRRATELLQQRDAASLAVAQEIKQVGSELQRIEDERESVHGSVDRAAEELAEIEAEVQQLLEGDDEYQEQLDVARSAQSIAHEAEEKTRLAEQDKEDKGEPYRDSKLFMYLWQRRYGTSEYDGYGLMSMLDDWVAGLCNYDEARANYWMLQEIPKRLNDHARAVAKRAELEAQGVQEIEVRVANAAGVDEAQRRLLEAEQAQDECDGRIDATEERLSELQEQQSRFAMGEDEYLEQILEMLASAYQRRDVRDLERMVERTLELADDRIVRRLADLREEYEDLREQLLNNKDVHRQHSERLKELEDVRRRFKRHRFDDLRSSFGSEDLIRMILGEFVRGAVRGGNVWDTLRRQQRYRDVGGAWPDFGSGGLSRSRRSGSPWHWPGGRGGFRIPRGGGPRSRSRVPSRRSRGGSRGGGFRTGGGF